MSKLLRVTMLNRIILAGFLIVILGQSANHHEALATIVRHLTLEDLIEQADLIVIGEYQGKTSAWDVERKRIFTYITIDPKRCLKGNECPPHLQIRQMGGVVDDIAMTVAGTSSFYPNEQVLLFLQKRSAHYYQILGLSQGKFTILHRGKEDAAYVQRDLRSLTLLRKSGQRFFLEAPSEPDNTIDLGTFIKKIESHLDFH